MAERAWFGVAVKRASSLATGRSNIERHIKILLGKKRIAVLAREGVERFQQDVASATPRRI